ncbi:hypothetical protein GCM10009854_39950 [Saccharopolyspora halophila]|uniref:Uncharacterized protein n=1 Tax=Saccharopolyspora halophila TaxID=405551 RepID=A0ABN3GQ35_9PSEU
MTEEGPVRTHRLSNGYRSGRALPDRSPEEHETAVPAGAEAGALSGGQRARTAPGHRRRRLPRANAEVAA